MPRQAALRPNNYYHIYLSSQNEAVLFEDDTAYRQFLADYAELIEPIAETFAYCLLPKHFHFFVRLKTIQQQIEDWYVGDSAETVPTDFTPLNPTDQLNKLLTNLPTNNLSNKSANDLLNIIPVGDPNHYPYLIRYIHQNSTLHGEIDNFRDWPHSSYQTILKQKSSRIPTETVLKWFYTLEWYEEIHWETQDPTQIGYLILED